MLPSGGRTKMVAIGVAKTSKQVLNFTADRMEREILNRLIGIKTT